MSTFFQKNDFDADVKKVEHAFGAETQIQNFFSGGKNLTRELKRVLRGCRGCISSDFSRVISSI
jgi:hypothetical protein